MNEWKWQSCAWYCLLCGLRLVSNNLIECLRYRYVKYLIVLFLISITCLVVGQKGKCDQTPLQATVSTPSENKGYFKLSIENKKQPFKYIPDQTYVGKLYSAISSKTI